MSAHLLANFGGNLSVAHPRDKGMTKGVEGEGAMFTIYGSSLGNLGGFLNSGKLARQSTAPGGAFAMEPGKERRSRKRRRGILGKVGHENWMKRDLYSLALSFGFS